MTYFEEQQAKTKDINTIDGINNWLESKAVRWELEIKQNPYLSGATWPTYYRGLKDFDKQGAFMLSSADMENPIYRYLHVSCSGQYKYDGYTGCCCITKIK